MSRPSPCISFPLNSQRALSTPGPFPPRHHCVIGNAYPNPFTHERSLSQANAHSSIPLLPNPELSSPRAAPLLPLPFPKITSEPRVSSGNIREDVLSSPLRSFSRLPRVSLPSLIARKYTVEEQFGPAVESVLWV